MEQVTTIGLDIAKHVFQVHGADAAGHVLFRKRVTRTKLIGFLAAQTPCVVAMEACAGAHYWAREIGKLGHRVRLIPRRHLMQVRSMRPGRGLNRRPDPPVRGSSASVSPNRLSYGCPATIFLDILAAPPSGRRLSVGNLSVACIIRTRWERAAAPY